MIKTVTGKPALAAGKLKERDSWGNVIRRVPFGRGLDVLKEGIIIDD